MNRRGALLALLQSGLLLSLSGQLLLERLLLPRGWLRVQPRDPNLPIRGRYITLTAEVPVLPSKAANGLERPLQLIVQQGRVVARPLPAAAAVDERGSIQPSQIVASPDGLFVRLPEPLAFFIPPDVADPSRRPASDPLWVEVTLPADGPPRPIRLGQQRNGRIVPLALR